jgi:N-formylglutamate amidohydrolase
MPFDVIEPRATEVPVVVEVPHASLALDPRAIATLAAPACCIGQDADLYVDELYTDAPSLGATMLVSRTSRYACDLNRSEADVDARAVAGAPRAAPPAPHGLIWRQSTDGREVLREPLGREEFERRLNDIYRPYHATLRELLDQKCARFGYVILLAAHSMPSSGRSGHPDAGSERAAIVPGSRARTSAAAVVIDCPDPLAARRGWSVAHDQPYRGGFTTAHYGRPALAVHALQVELNRNLYMDEDTLAPLAGGFEQTRDYCRELVQQLAALPAGLLKI